MNGTGIVRRVDDLGRIVIPKEVRRSLRIREGDPMELFPGEAGSGILTLKRCSHVGKQEDLVRLLQAINQTIGVPALLCDRDNIIAAAGAKMAKYEGRAITSIAGNIIEDRKLYVHGDDTPIVYIIVDSDLIAEIIMPFAANGYLFGALIIPKHNDDLHWDNTLISLKLAAKYLELYLGDVQ